MDQLSSELRNFIISACGIDFVDDAADFRDTFGHTPEAVKQRLDQEFTKILQERSLSMDDAKTLTSQPFHDEAKMYAYFAEVYEYFFKNGTKIPQYQ